MSSNLTASAKFMVMGMANIRKIGMRANSRNWLLVIGLLCIVAACIAAYLITAPAEADISLLRDRPDANYSAYSAFA